MKSQWFFRTLFQQQADTLTPEGSTSSQQLGGKRAPWQESRPTPQPLFCLRVTQRAGRAGARVRFCRWAAEVQQIWIWTHCGPRRNAASRCLLERGSLTAAFLAAAEAECRAGAAARSARSPTRARGARSASSFEDCEVCKCNILFVTARCARLLPSLSALM